MLLDEAFEKAEEEDPKDVPQFLATYFADIVAERGGSPATSGPTSPGQLSAAQVRITDLERELKLLRSKSSDVGSPSSGKSRKTRTITARACVVCGRDDRAGEVRAKGFKCHECVGLPSNQHFVREIDTDALVKGRDEDGLFVINDYTIIKNLGKGAYGKVRLCSHNHSNQSYAVKCLAKVCNPHHVTNSMQFLSNTHPSRTP